MAQASVAKKFTVKEPKGALKPIDIKERAVSKDVDGKIVVRSDNEFVIYAQGDAGNMKEFESWLRKNFGLLRVDPGSYQTMQKSFIVVK